MRTTFILSISILIVFFSSCSNSKEGKPNGNNDIEIIKALDKSNTINSLLDIFDLEKIVELNTVNSNVIGSVKCIKVEEEYIFILDVLRGTVYRFDKEGNFLNTIGKKGGGPGEFLAPTDFALDLTREEIIVLDNRKKILKYKFSGEFITDIKIPVYAKRIALLKGDKFMLDGYTYSNEGRFNSIFIVDEKGKILEEALPFPKMYDEKTFLISSGIQGDIENYSICFPMNDTIYQYSNNSLHPRYILDFEKERLSDEIFENCKNNEEVVKKSLQLNKVLYTHRYFEINNICFAVYVKGSSPLSTTIYSKTNRKVYFYNGKNISDIVMGTFSTATNKNELVFVLRPYYLADENLKFRIRNMDLKYGDNESYQKIKAEYQRAAKLDNPVLLFFKPKPGI